MFCHLWIGFRGHGIISMLLIWLLVAIIIPWQVALLVCWIIHLVTCATNKAPASDDATTPVDSLSRTRNSPTSASASRNDGDHVLLLLTWLLPFAAPVLAVWVRTLATAGLIALGSVGVGDHNFLSVAPYLILAEYASRTRDPLLTRDK
jgi:GPI inositol-deacylase